jgi:uncharacterized protein (TIGR03382 family)
MHRTSCLLAVALALRLVVVSAAAPVVHPPLPITHRVSVRMIQTALDDGTSPAPLFGDPTRDAAVKAAIDTIWAQAGIDIRFLPNVIRYNDTFAYQGLGGGVRPIGDLDVIVAQAAAQGGILHSSPNVINMFFVNVVPGFDLKNDNWVNGVGHVGASGIAMYIGENTSADHAAHWVAHEIGHNLGLSHATAGAANLMSTTRNTEFLTSEQIEAVLQSPFAFRFPGSIAGDYDRNGTVDAADYALWRNTFNSRSNLAADGNFNGIVDHGDLMIWRGNFGRSQAASAEAHGEPDWSRPQGTPEPSAAMLAVWGVALTAMLVRRRR